MNHSSPDSLGRQAYTDEISPYDDISGESAVPCRFSVIALCQRFARNLERILLVSSDWRNEVSQQEIFRACSLGHRSQVGRCALTKVRVWKHPAALVRSHDGMDR